MREATAAERKAIDDYIASISVDTGFNLWELQEQVKVYDAYYNKGYEQGKKDTINKFAVRLLCEVDNMNIQKTVMRIVEELREE